MKTNWLTITENFKKLREEDLRKELDKAVSKVMFMRSVGVSVAGPCGELVLAEQICRMGNPAISVGKELYRSGNGVDVAIFDVNTSKKEINSIISKRDWLKFVSMSVKVYGETRLQLTTDPESLIRSECEKYGKNISPENVEKIKNSSAIKSLLETNLMVILYKEATPLNNRYTQKGKLRKHVNLSNTYRIVTFNAAKAINDICSIEFSDTIKGSLKKKTHSTYEFKNKYSEVIFTACYGDKKANALQRGPWINDIKNSKYLDVLVAEREFVTDVNGEFLKSFTNWLFE